MAGRLAGKTAIVVGAGQQPGETVGNGRAIALTFAREGASVLCVDREESRARATADEIVQQGGTAQALAVDVTDPAAGDAIAAQCSDDWQPDILVYNVGIGSAGDGPAHRHDDAAFAKIFEVNFSGARRITRAILPLMRAREKGAIVTVSSLASIAGANMLGYEVSKAALNRLTVSIARANAKYGIRANGILPGLMDTPMAMVGTSERDGRSIEDQRIARDAMVPLKGGMGSGWDTAAAALFLASDEAQFITGVLLPVDGGASTRVG